MFGKAGKFRQVKFLRPFPVGHHIMPPSDVRHAAVEQQPTCGVGGVAPLDIQAAEGAVSTDKRGVQHHERAGAVRLTDILAQRLQHSLLQPLHSVRVPIQFGKVRCLFFQNGGHVLGEMKPHYGDIPPQGFHVRLKRLHPEGQRFRQLLPGTFQLSQQKKDGEQRYQQQRRQCAHVEEQPPSHGGLGLFQFGKRKPGHGPSPSFSMTVFSMDSAQQRPGFLCQCVNAFTGSSTGGKLLLHFPQAVIKLADLSVVALKARLG